MAIPKVKICGIRRLEDAVVAADAGADYIGLVFVPGRPRRVDIPTAAAIVSGIKANGVAAPKVVGLFADQPLEEVNHTANACGLDLLQLCGGESTEYCAGAVRPVIKVVHVSSSIKGPDFTGDATADTTADESAWQTLVERIKSYSSAGNMVTLDRLVEGIPGGTGESFDWGVAAELSRRGHSFLLAGGTSAGYGRAGYRGRSALGRRRFQRCGDPGSQRRRQNQRFHPGRQGVGRFA